MKRNYLLLVLILFTTVIHFYTCTNDSGVNDNTENHDTTTMELIWEKIIPGDSSNRADTISISYYDGKNERRLTPLCTYTHFSVSGNKIAWSDRESTTAPAEIFLYENKSITQVTHDGKHYSNPLFSHGYIVWSSPDSMGWNQLFLCDVNDLSYQQITSGQHIRLAPRASGNRIVWIEFDITIDATNIFYFDGEKTINLSKDSANGMINSDHQISDRYVVWLRCHKLSKDSNEVMVYDGSKKYGISTYTHNYSPQTSEGNVVWTAKEGTIWRLCWYDSAETKLIDLNNYDSISTVSVHGGNIAFCQNHNLYLHDGNTKRHVAAYSDYPHETIQISCSHSSKKDRVAFSSLDMYGKWQVYLWNGDDGSITQITDGTNINRKVKFIE